MPCEQIKTAMLELDDAVLNDSVVQMSVCTGQEKDDCRQLFPDFAALQFGTMSELMYGRALLSFHALPFLYGRGT